MIPISFEYFPPKTEQGLVSLIDTTHCLQLFQPDFFSVTYGAGGSAQNHTLTTITALRDACNIQVAAHISCIYATKDHIRQLLQQYQQHHINHLIVLRGDLPSGMLSFSDDFKYAYQLIEFIRKETGDYFFIDCAAYPETHPETQDPQKNIDHLKIKAQAGANRAITQYFFNTDAYFYFRDDCAKNQLALNVIPGIMPITNYTQLMRFSTLCGAEIPRWLRVRLEKFKENTEALCEIGQAFVTRLCQQLIAGGAPGLHFYTLNKATSSTQILKNLNSYDRLSSSST